MPDCPPNELEVLLAATARGDRTAFARLYELTGGTLFGIALGMLGQRDRAEDATQEAYLLVWRKAGQYSPDRGSALAWLTTLTRRCAIDQLRRRKREPAGVDAAELPLAAAEPSASDSLDAALIECLKQLRADSRQAILLAFYHGLTHDELARRLNAPLGTVKSWVRRGLQRLKACLDPETESPS